MDLCFGGFFPSLLPDVRNGKSHGKTHPRLRTANLIGGRRGRSCGLQVFDRMNMSYSRSFKEGVDAAIEDFVVSGLNICIAGRKGGQRDAILDSLEEKINAGSLVDLAVCTTSGDEDCLRKRNIPTDFSVNLKKNIDLLIAALNVVDENCNAVLNSKCFVADKFAASLAEKTVLLIDESDFEQSRRSLRSIPVQLVNFQSEQGVNSLCSSALVDTGVRGATLRDDGSSIADVALSLNALPFCVEAELQKLPQVIGTGLLPASEKTVVVVATSEGEPFDLTPTLHTIASLDADSRSKALSLKKRDEQLGTLKKAWEIKQYENDEALCREFKFTTGKRAQAFLQYIHHVANRGGGLNPKIGYSKCTVTIEIMTEGAGGITTLDVLLSKELSTSYSLIQA